MALAAVSGLTDVDAITLSSMQLLDNGALSEVTALSAVGVAVAANLVFKAVVAASAGGPLMRWAVLRAFIGPLLALSAGLWALHALA
jgi:uncharacterized membrane protein (DUF4010 family)